MSEVFNQERIYKMGVEEGAFVSSLDELIEIASTGRQCTDGVFRSRWVIVCADSQEMRYTKSELQQKYASRINANGMHTITASHTDGRKFECEIVLMSNADGYKKLLGLELTGALIPESCDEELMHVIFIRTGRYPSLKMLRNKEGETNESS